MSIQFSGSWEVQSSVYSLHPQEKALKLATRAKDAFQKHAAEIEALPSSVKLEYNAYTIAGAISKYIYVSMQLRHYPPTDPKKGLIKFPLVQKTFQSTEKFIQSAIRQAQARAKNRNIV